MVFDALGVGAGGVFVHAQRDQEADDQLVAFAGLFGELAPLGCQGDRLIRLGLGQAVAHEPGDRPAHGDVAHAELGRFEHALELVAGDESATARRLRADVAWDRRDWPDAGRRLESALGTRWQDDTPLGESEQADVLRTAIAFNFAGDRDSIRRLDQRYGALMRATAQATSFDVLTSELTVTGDARVGDLARRIADIDTLDAFMQRYQTRFESGGGES